MLTSAKWASLSVSICLSDSVSVSLSRSLKPGQTATGWRLGYRTVGIKGGSQILNYYCLWGYTGGGTTLVSVPL